MWLTLGIRRRYVLYRRTAATEVTVNASDGITVRGSVKDVRQSFDVTDPTHPDTLSFFSSSVPNPGHRIVRFAEVLR
jgi:hypothetical protein